MYTELLVTPANLLQQIEAALPGQIITFILQVVKDNQNLAIPFIITLRDPQRHLSKRAAEQSSEYANWVYYITNHHCGIISAYLCRDIGLIDKYIEINQYYPNAISLDQYAKSTSNLTPSRLCKMLKPTIEAIDYLHNLNFVHRDIKPSNIMVIPITDFLEHELAKLQAQGMLDDTLTELCLLHDIETILPEGVENPPPARTCRYADLIAFPDSSTGFIPPVSRATDIFCFGVSVLELLIMIKNGNDSLLYTNHERTKRERITNLVRQGQLTTAALRSIKRYYKNYDDIRAVLELAICPDPTQRVSIQEFYEKITAVLAHD